jgi:hypothetical protein
VPSTNEFATVASDGSLSATNRFTVTVQLPPASAPIIQTVDVAGGFIALTWTSVPARFYRLEYNENLGTTNWVSVPPDVQATETTTTAINAVGASPQRFYRILVVP